MNNYCGIDFGTSNSTVGIRTQKGFQLATLEGENRIMPTVIFFDGDNHDKLFGEEALSQYIEGAEGRLIRSIKSILGSDLMHEKTMINGRQTSLKEIIGHIVCHMKKQVERSQGCGLSNVVLGRPVHFNDDDPDKDREAERLMKEIAMKQGFKNVEFQYEPIAAALAYEEQQVEKETLVLIADIGGGTSDFSVIRLGTKKEDRKKDILANAGVHIGGTDFDRKISMKDVMPFFGKGSEVWSFSGEKRSIPVSYFNDMATWHRINSLYTDKTREIFTDYLRNSLDPDRLERFYTLIDYELGHQLNASVEKQKQRLSTRDFSTLNLDFVEKGLQIELTQKNSNLAIEDELEKLSQITGDILKQAGVSPDRIEAVFFTGGSTKNPVLRQRIFDVIPNADVVEGDAFGSVGYGLIVDAEKRFN